MPYFLYPIFFKATVIEPSQWETEAVYDPFGRCFALNLNGVLARDTGNFITFLARQHEDETRVVFCHPEEMCSPLDADIGGLTFLPKQFAQVDFYIEVRRNVDV